MKRRLKTALLVVLSVALIGGGCYGYYAVKKAWYQSHVFPVPDNLNELETVPYIVDFLFDRSDLEKMTAATDYIFVGCVEQCVGTTYQHAEFMHGTWTGTPHTHYLVTNLFNIKGRLQTEAQLPVEASGGVEIGSKKVEPPIMGFLEKGHYYILLVGVTQEDELYLNDCVDLGAQPDMKELAGYFDTLEKQPDAVLPDNASFVLRSIDRYVQAYLHRDLSYEKAERFHSSYEMEETDE